MLAVDACGLGKRLAGKWVLEDVDLAVASGGCVAVMGPNGSGKSTLLRIVAGAMPADRGTLNVGGHDAAQAPEAVRAGVGSYFGEERSWYWRLSGLQNLEFFAALRPPTSDRPSAPADLMELVGLTGVAHRRVGEYSTGMRARLGLARALLGDAPLLVLDEPTRSLDPASASEFHRVVLRSLSDGRTVVLGTHDLAEARRLATEVVNLVEGRVAAASGGPKSASARRPIP